VGKSLIKSYNLILHVQATRTVYVLVALFNLYQSGRCTGELFDEIREIISIN